MAWTVAAIVAVCIAASANGESLDGGEGQGGGGGGGGGGITLRVEHSLDDGATFTQRGTLSVHNLRSGSASMDSSPLSFGKEQLRELCASDGLYLLRFVSKDGNALVHRAAIHACNLVDSGLRDVLTVNLDWKNQVVSVSASAAAIPVPDDVAFDEAPGFDSNVLMRPMEMGPQPDTATFVQRMEQEKLAKERGETKDNRSFIAKYWMYIIPVVLVLAMSGANPDAQR